MVSKNYSFQAHNKNHLCKMLLLHTTSWFVFETLNTFFQKLFCDNGSNGPHQTHNLMYLHTLLGASLQPEYSVCSTSRNNPLEWQAFSPFPRTSATTRGRISNQPARQGETDSTQSWLFQCQMITHTSTDCWIRHLISEAGKTGSTSQRTTGCGFPPLLTGVPLQGPLKVHWPVQ